MTQLASPSRASLASALLSPESVAIVGASDDSEKTTGRPLRFLRTHGYAGRIYPVNPHRDTVQGERAWASLRDLPEVPEHVYVVAPTAVVLDVVKEAGELGVSVVTVLASGFAEAGPIGTELQNELTRVARESGVRLVGPSSLGVVNTRNGFVLTANAVFGERDLPRGSTFAVSQSGSMIGALVSRGKSLGIGFAGLVSTGGSADLSVGEICSATLDSPEIRSYLLFLEGVDDSDSLREFARVAAQAGKPVVVYKLGRSAAGEELSLSHTGAIAGSDAASSAFFADNAMARVNSIDALLEGLPLAELLASSRVDRGGRVGVVTTTGGGAAMVVDQLGVRGIEVHHPSERVFAALQEAGVPAEPSRIVDLTLTGVRLGAMRSAITVMRDSGEFDVIVTVVGSSARTGASIVVEDISESQDPRVPIAAFIVPDAPQEQRTLVAKGVPTFHTPESCADALAAILGRRVPDSDAQVPVVAPEYGGSAWLDESESYALVTRHGVTPAPHTVISATADIDEQIAAISLRYPLVAKVLDADILHKSDVGGVRVGIADASELRQAITQIVTDVEALQEGAKVSRVLIQEMVKGVGELLVGYRIDPGVGPIIVASAGGVFAEISESTSVRTAPITAATAHEMLDEMAYTKILKGYRNSPPGDLDAVVHVMVGMSQLAVSPSERVIEAELNPLIVGQRGAGAFAVDALVRVAGRA